MILSVKGAYAYIGKPGQGRVPEDHIKTIAKRLCEKKCISMNTLPHKGGGPGAHGRTDYMVSDKVYAYSSVDGRNPGAICLRGTSGWARKYGTDYVSAVARDVAKEVKLFYDSAQTPSENPQKERRPKLKWGSRLRKK